MNKLDLQMALEEKGVDYEANATNAQLKELLAKAEDELVDHVLTEEDLEENPGIREAGAEVGDTIGLPKEATEEPETGDEEADEEVVEDEVGTATEGLCVASRLKHNGRMFEIGESWPFSETQAELTASLLANGTLK